MHCSKPLVADLIPPFERLHHRRIAAVLTGLNAPLLHQMGCWFGGGTAIVLRRGEYRESVDIDFMVSNKAGYRELRQLMRGVVSLRPLMRDDMEAIPLEREALVDQYGIRSFLLVQNTRIKFEIVSEGRMAFDTPTRHDKICGVDTLTLTDLGASKLLANSDRWRDEAVFSRDIIDLAMLNLPTRKLRHALDKARAAYGKAVVEDLQSAFHMLHQRQDWLGRCIQALSIQSPPAAVQQNLRALVRRLRIVSQAEA